MYNQIAEVISFLNHEVLYLEVVATRTNLISSNSLITLVRVVVDYCLEQSLETC